MTEYRAAIIQEELEKLKRLCLMNDGDLIRATLIDYMEEIIQALPTTK